MGFVKATPQGRKLRMSIEGQSGSGKTTTALRVATGLVQREGGKIALIDAEEGRAKLSAGRFDFAISVLDSRDYSPEAYVREIEAAAKAGFSVLIIDSATKEWESLLNDKDNMPDKEQFSAWGTELNPRHAKFTNAIAAYPGHVIVTLRSKMKHMIQGGGDGKKAKVVKLGMEPIARPQTEYDYDLALELDAKSACALSKRPRGVFHLVDSYRKTEPGEELGHQIADALAGKLGAAPDEPEETPAPKPAPVPLADKPHPVPDAGKVIPWATEAKEAKAEFDRIADFFKLRRDGSKFDGMKTPKVIEAIVGFWPTNSPPAVRSALEKAREAEKQAIHEDGNEDVPFDLGDEPFEASEETPAPGAPPSPDQPTPPVGKEPVSPSDPPRTMRPPPPRLVPAGDQAQQPGQVAKPTPEAAQNRTPDGNASHSTGRPANRAGAKLKDATAKALGRDGGAA